MKPVLQIFSALCTAFLHAGGTESYPTIAVVLILVGRIALALFILPLVLICFMAGDSGTLVSGFGALILVYAMSLLFWAALLLSWRCAVACGCIMLSFVLSTLVLEDSDDLRNLGICCGLVVLCFVFTELWPAPIRTTMKFVMWCRDDGNADSNSTYSFAAIPTGDFSTEIP